MPELGYNQTISDCIPLCALSYFSPVLASYSVCLHKEFTDQFLQESLYGFKECFKIEEQKNWSFQSTLFHTLHYTSLVLYQIYIIYKEAQNAFQIECSFFHVQNWLSIQIQQPHSLLQTEKLCLWFTIKDNDAVIYFVTTRISNQTDAIWMSLEYIIEWIPLKLGGWIWRKLSC